MQVNEFQEIRMNICRKIKQIFGNKVGSLEIFDVVEESGHWSFSIRFAAYNYFVIIFNYELDIIGFSIEAGAGYTLSLSNERVCYSDVDLDSYVKQVMKELELRIPDKYLEAKGW